MKKFTEIKIIQGFAFILIPLFLYFLTGEIRGSISDYAYSTAVMSFSVMLTLAGALFFYDGYVERKRFYNMIIGAALIGVVLTPHLEYAILHYIFASIFFIGSVFSMIYFSSKKQRPIKIVVGSVIILALLMYFIFNIFSLFWAEWIGMIPICLHYIGESLGKVD